MSKRVAKLAPPAKVQNPNYLVANRWNCLAGQQCPTYLPRRRHNTHKSLGFKHLQSTRQDVSSGYWMDSIRSIDFIAFRRVSASITTSMRSSRSDCASFDSVFIFMYSQTAIFETG